MREVALAGQRQREALKVPCRKQWRKMGQRGTRPCGVFSQGQDVEFGFENCGQLWGGEFDSCGGCLLTECMNR